MKIQLTTLFILLLNNLTFTQTINGKILDEYQQAIQGVNILNINSKSATASDNFGAFELSNCSLNDTVEFSLIGFESQFVIINNLENNLNIQLAEKNFTLEEITISPQLDALQIIADVDIQTTPVSSSQDILRKVPGLIIGQHAGGGKAEQIFLRGFDIDHGTDISITVDGLPVNMVSHAHGQGYADLHFLIPETIERVDFGKGPYYQDKGNFTTAGYINFETKDRLQNNTIKLEAGQFNSYRALGMFNLASSTNHNAYIASEYLLTDGFFESSQNFNRINVFGKYNGNISNQDKLGLTLSYFDSQWDASGQIPVRAVESGLISRFGAIDDTEGGTTSRMNLLINYDKIFNNNSSLKNKIFVNQYDFELYSNFTFFLDNPTIGDQIRQRENRMIYGLESEFFKAFSNENLSGSWEAGIHLRHDRSRDNELSKSANRTETIERIQFGDIDETNIGAHIGSSLELNKWTFKPSIRVDFFDFQYTDRLLMSPDVQKENASIISPNFNIFYNPNSTLQLYLKTGKGFHSNDTRVVIANEGMEILPPAYGVDLGYIWKPDSNILVNMAYWYLFMEQEFVYVGDAGIVEPSGRTRRQGIELSSRFQPSPQIFFNLDANYTLARSIDEPEGEDYIPLAPDFTMVAGLNINLRSGLFGNLNLRHIANRPANEDNSIVAEGYTVTDLNLGYQWNNISFGVNVQNLFDTEWIETQFATESRLQTEIEPVEEIHFTPGTPFFIKGILQYDF